MIRPLLVLAALAAALVPTAAAAAPVAPVAPAAPAGWHDGACAPDDNVGITLVIDFQELGGGVNLRCADGPVADGADALDQAGINWQGVVRWGRGFVCKIAGKPANDPCIDTPPASAYWSYWVAPRGGSWCYSNFGVLNRTPPPGSVEGWSFSLDRQDGTSPPPGLAPPRLAPGLTPKPLPGNDCDPSGPDVAEPLPPTTTTTRPSSGGGGGEGGGIDGRPGATTTPPSATTDPGVPTTTVPGAPTTSTTSSSTTTTTTSPTTTTSSASTAAPSAGSAADDGERAAPPKNQVDLSTDGDEQTGFPVSTVVGLVLVVALAIGAVLARRRRSTPTPS